MNLWLTVYDNLLDHPKLFRLTAILGVSRADALYHLMSLWFWALSYAMDGDLSRFTHTEIAKACRHEGEDFVAFVDALANAGWLDLQETGGYAIHDWHLYGGKIMATRKAAAEKAKARRERERNANVPGTYPVRNANVPGTYPNTVAVRTHAEERRGEQSLGEETTGDRLALASFNRVDDWWNKIQARLNGTPKDWEAIRAALALPGMTADRILRELDPIIESKRKKGERIAGFAYCLKILESLVHRDKLAADVGLVASVACLPSAKPRIEDEDHYRFLVGSGIFNADDWANADEFEGAF